MTARAGEGPAARSRGDETAGRSLLLLLGPTASGKTAVALALAERLPLEVVSADSRQVYRALDVGTAKPTSDERRRVVHHMIDVADPDETMNAGRYGREASAAAASVRAAGREPLVAGGAGLYVRALLGGLAANLPRDEAVRAELERDADAEGSAALHARLTRIDPAAAGRIAVRDRVRIVRALEVAAITGRPITELHDAGRVDAPRHRAVYLAREPSDLAGRIGARAARMLEDGLVEETQRVLARWPDARTLLAKTVGYAAALAALEGRLPRDALLADVSRATRGYARRQRIWFQRLPGLIVVPVGPRDAPERTADAVLDAFVRPVPQTAA